MGETKKYEHIKNDSPLVSICCSVYNHEKYIKQALDSFLMQKVDFQIEILVNDDCSTDGSADIIREYTKNYPNIIKPVFQKENQYSKGIKPMMQLLFPRARGKYLALCEGDDYWLDPEKLQKQVDFLEKNTDYSLCCGAYETIHMVTGEKGIEKETKWLKNRPGFSFAHDEMSIKWFTKTLTCMLRKSTLDEVKYDILSYKDSRDVQLFYYMVKNNKGYYFADILGVYRIHAGGVKSLVGDRINKMGAYYRSEELYLKNKDNFTKSLHLRSVFSLFKYSLQTPYEGNNFRNKLKLGFEILRLCLSLTFILYLLKVYLRVF